MPLSILITMATAAATAGLGCGVTCGACGSPLSNVFLSSYLFTHSGRLKRGIFSFLMFFAGKMAAVVILCVIAALAGSQIIDEAGRLLSIDLRMAVRIAMLLMTVLLIFRWIWRNNNGSGAGNGCGNCKTQTKSGLPMLACGFLSGVSPCAPLLLVLGYSATVSAYQAVVVGVAFSLANSIIPLILLTILTGVLSKEMFREIPAKIKWFQLGAYLLFAVISGAQLIAAI
jgi:hypothetical protein